MTALIFWAAIGLLVAIPTYALVLLILDGIEAFDSGLASLDPERDESITAWLAGTAEPDEFDPFAPEPLYGPWARFGSQASRRLALVDGGED